MALEYSEHVYYKEDYHENSREWFRDTQRRTSSWRSYDFEWKQPACKVESLSSSQARPIALNIEIDKLYEEIAALVKQRDSYLPASQLEAQIAQRFQCLRVLQKQEGERIRALSAALSNTQLNTGLALLERVEQRRAQYGNPTATDASATDAHRPQA